MRLRPKHPASRRVAALWLLACAATLVVMLLRSDFQAGDRAALSTLVPMYWLSLPLGHAGVLAVIEARTALYLSGMIPGIPAEGLLLWLALGVLGYVQWFLLLPLVARKCQQLLHFLFDLDVAKNRPTC
jgi:hypothetical protein